MIWPLRLSLLAIFALVTGQAVFYLIYAGFKIPYPFEFHALEGKMVHLAWRVQASQRLYPTWGDYPHVSNYYSPLYWLIVGGLGRFAGVGLDGLTWIGRVVSFSATILVSITLGLAAGRRYGGIAGLIAGLMSLGGSPLFGFSVMTRPDMLAEWFGLLGFFLAIGRSDAGRRLGVALLVAAVLTKQTAGIYLLASWLGLVVSGRRRTGWALFASALGLLALVLLVVQLAVEPNFIPSLLADSRTPWSPRNWLFLLERIFRESPQIPALAGGGILLWTIGPPSVRDPALAALAIIGLIAGAVTAGKMGADVNYFLPLNAVAVLAMAAAWRALTLENPKNEWAPFVLTLLGALLMTSFLHAARNAREAYRDDSKLKTPEAQTRARVYRDLFAMAEDPRRRILSDDVLVDIHQYERTAFGDPYLFAIQVETGSVVPTRMLRWIEAGEYDLIVCHSNLDDPNYHLSFPRLPMPLVEAARHSYQLDKVEAGLSFYRPRNLP